MWLHSATKHGLIPLLTSSCSRTIFPSSLPSLLSFLPSSPPPPLSPAFPREAADVSFRYFGPVLSLCADTVQTSQNSPAVARHQAVMM